MGTGQRDLSIEDSHSSSTTGIHHEVGVNHFTSSNASIRT